MLRILTVTALLAMAVATVVAIRQVRRTRYSASWILMAAVFAIMCVILLDGMFGISLKPSANRWLTVAVSLCLASSTLLLSMIFDYIDTLDTHRRLTEKRLLSTTIRTEEKDRQQFSKELHDGLGPLLSSARMALSAVSDRNDREVNREIISNAMKVIDESICSLREISNNLSPHILQDFGLTKGISNFIDHLVNASNVRISFRTNLDTERFQNDTEVILYRVTGELINNSLKHSGCGHIDISLQYTDGFITLSYQDDGRGFIPENCAGKGMGLSNIASRINSLKGDFTLQSEPGKGMRATIRVKAGKEKM